MKDLAFAFPFLIITGFGMMSPDNHQQHVDSTHCCTRYAWPGDQLLCDGVFGMQPIGGLLVGSLSHYIGAANTLLAQGMVTLIIAFLFMPFLRRRELKPQHKMKIDQLEERSVETTG
jgi:drug/metabolite transporter (DMT)-like permease